MTTVKSFLRFAGRMDHPFLTEAPPKVYSKKSRYLTYGQYAELKKALSKEPVEREWLQRAVIISIATGARASTALQLRKEDVVNGVVHISRDIAKTGSYTVPLFPPLESLLERVDSGLIVGRPVRTDLLSHRFSRIRDTLSWPKDFTFHVLRHTFASWMVMKGVPLYTVSQWMGHQSINITERYAHLAPTTDAEKGKRIIEEATK